MRREFEQKCCLILTLMAFLSVSASWRKLSNSFMLPFGV